MTLFKPPHSLLGHSALLAILLLVAVGPVCSALPSAAVIVEDQKAPRLFGLGKTTPAILTASALLG